MSTVLDPLAAAEVYAATLEPRERSGWARWTAGVLDLWCAQAGGRFELTGQGVVVVRRRSDGVAELRLPTCGGEAAAHLLALVREQLDDLDPPAFRAVWGIA